MLRRFSEDHLARWFRSRRRKPLVLRGARQVGKSTLVRRFAFRQGLKLAEINLERHLSLQEAFVSFDVKSLLRELEVLTRTPIHDGDSLLFLDEVQAIPAALQALRYLHEERPSLAVIAAGSLLEFTLADHSFSMPVGRIEYMQLGPLTFKEFLEATESELIPLLESFDVHGSSRLPGEAHRRLLAYQRQFLLVGGMPEAVSAFTGGGTIDDVVRIHRSIMETYLDDFSKYARKGDLALLQKVVRSVPRNIGQKVKYVNVSREERSRDVKRAIDLLAMARLCTPVFHSACSGIPLLADIDEDRFKLLFLDVGLMSHVTGMDPTALRSLTDTQLVNEGKLAEQFVGQHLLGLSAESAPPGLTYWMREGRSTNAEVDFVWSRGNWIVPIEVKAGSSGTLRSLHQFVLQKSPPVAVRFDLNPPGMQKVTVRASTFQEFGTTTFDLVNMPLYAIEELPRLIDALRTA